MQDRSYNQGWFNVKSEKAGFDYIIFPRMETTWDEFYYKRSVVAVVEKFLKTVDDMKATVLIPCRLMDIPVTEILYSPSAGDPFLKNNIDLCSFYSFMKALRTQIALGANHIEENEEHNSPFQCEIEETTRQINKLALVAKYLGATDLFSQAVPFDVFESQVRFTEECTLLDALRKFQYEVQEMEKAMLFPNRLKDHELVGNWPRMPSNVRSLQDVYSLLKLLKKELIDGPQKLENSDPKLQQKLSDIYHTLRQYTTMTLNLIERYKKEVQCA
ncbi:uncharacterized protein LOC5521849 [Nematostella vectensis]|uniref:uncharacterized protein LOC5521849 n=1 Tax=Nematostella vectensis TaxID=45351 RepID=UPI00207760CA|nr:uncharacterized protein LOC5521849 [Nematostella vectensis]